MMPIEQGQLIQNRYRIVKLLGQGGFGAVYRAWDTSLERICALKENFDTSEEAQRQFKREAVILANLSHPNLPHVIDHFSLPDQGQYLVMEYIEGEDLQTMLEQTGKPLPPDKVLPWIGQICDALSYLHEQIPPIIHRDIKPANIKITPSGKAVLVDFGIAKVFDPHLRTTVGARAVTPGFSPPEQYGQGTTDVRSDVYSIAATLYALLTGKAPPDGVDIMSGNAPQPPLPHTINQEVSPGVSEAVSKAMQVSRTGRFGSILSFKEALGLAPMASLQKEAKERPAVLVQTESSVSSYQPTREAVPLAAIKVVESIPKTEIVPSVSQAVPAPVARTISEPAKKGFPQWILVGCGAALVLAIIGLAVVVYIVGVGTGGPTETPTMLAESISSATSGIPSEIPLKPSDTPTIVSNQPTTPPTVIPQPEQPTFLACQVTDENGVDDNSFNFMVWRGVQLAMAKLGIDGKYLESANQADYGRNIETFIQEGCDIIIVTSFLFGDITKAYAEKFPDQKFSIVDFSYDPPLPNVVGQLYNIQEASFLAGYLAAGVSRTGVVGTYGGMQIPPVVDFMDGFVLGVRFYNQMHGTNVKVVGWDPDSQSGLFIGNFTNTEDGFGMGKQMVNQGADIIFPVAGEVGTGTAKLAAAFPNTFIIGVDSDWYLATPEYKGVMLTSAMKFMDITTYSVIEAAFLGNFKGSTYTGNLANSGVGLAPFHDLEKLVPQELIAELEKVKAMIISGEIKTKP